MADEDYQMRKDIDRFKHFLDNLEYTLSTKYNIGDANIIEYINRQLSKYYDQSVADLHTANLQISLSNVSSSLTNLSESLEDFNGALIDFDDDNTNLDSDLTKLKDNLLSFVNALGLLDVDLSELQSELNTLDVQLNGDNTHTGFVDVLSALQENIYGGTGYSISNPSSTSLKGMLLSFQSQLNDMSSGDDILSATLLQLKDYLTGFSGTLNQFKTQLTNAGIDITEINDGLLQIVYQIATTNDAIGTQQDLIEDMQDTIGESTDTSGNTLFGKIYTTNQTATSASSAATAVTNNVNNNISPAINTMTNTTIPSIKTKIGYDDIGSTSLQSQVTTAQNTANGANQTANAVDAKVGNVNVSVDGTLQAQVTSAKGIATGASTTATRAENATDAIKGAIGYDDIDVVGDGTLQAQVTTAQSTATTANGIANTLNNSVVPGIKTKIGYDDIGNTSLQSQINAQGDVIGNPNNLSSGSLISNINTVINDIDGVQGDIGDVQTKMYGGTGYSMQNPLGSSVKGLIDTAQDDITDAQNDILDTQTSIGAVDVATNNNLQNQIAELVDMINELTVSCAIVATVNDLNSINPRFYRKCYVVANDTYYRYTGEDILGNGGI